MKNVWIAVLVAGLTQTIVAEEDLASPVASIGAEELVDNNNHSPNWYASIETGLVVPMDSDVSFSGGSAELSYKSGYQIGAAVGLDLNQGGCLGCGNMPMRTEFALSYAIWTQGGSSFDQSDSSTSLLNFMFNGYWDFHNRSRVTPFLMGGLGFTWASIDDQGNSEDDTVFAGQFGGGIDVANKSIIRVFLT